MRLTLNFLLILFNVTISISAQNVEVIGAYSYCGQHSVSFLDLKKNGKFEWGYERNMIAYEAKGEWIQDGKYIILNPSLAKVPQPIKVESIPSDSKEVEVRLYINKKPAPKGYRGSIVTKDSIYPLRHGIAQISQGIDSVKVIYEPGIESSWIKISNSGINNLYFNLPNPKEEIVRDVKLQWSNRILTVLQENKNEFIESIDLNYIWIANKKDANECEYELLLPR